MLSHPVLGVSPHMITINGQMQQHFPSQAEATQGPSPFTGEERGKHGAVSQIRQSSRREGGRQLRP